MDYSKYSLGDICVWFQWSAVATWPPTQQNTSHTRRHLMHTHFDIHICVCRCVCIRSYYPPFEILCVFVCDSPADVKVAPMSLSQMTPLPIIQLPRWVFFSLHPCDDCHRIPSWQIIASEFAQLLTPVCCWLQGYSLATVFNRCALFCALHLSTHPNSAWILQPIRWELPWELSAN